MSSEDRKQRETTNYDTELTRYLSAARVALSVSLPPRADIEAAGSAASLTPLRCVDRTVLATAAAPAKGEVIDGRGRGRTGDNTCDVHIAIRIHHDYVQSPPKGISQVA